MDNQPVPIPKPPRLFNKTLSGSKILLLLLTPTNPLFYEVNILLSRISECHSVLIIMINMINITYVKVYSPKKFSFYIRKGDEVMEGVSEKKLV